MVLGQLRTQVRTIHSGTPAPRIRSWRSSMSCRHPNLPPARGPVKPATSWWDTSVFQFPANRQMCRRLGPNPWDLLQAVAGQEFAETSIARLAKACHRDCRVHNHLDAPSWTARPLPGRPRKHQSPGRREGKHPRLALAVQSSTGLSVLRPRLGQLRTVAGSQATRTKRTPCHTRPAMKNQIPYVAAPLAHCCILAQALHIQHRRCCSANQLEALARIRSLQAPSRDLLAGAQLSNLPRWRQRDLTPTLLN
mmetsp:Transcript_48945/g.116377  ORF Transcript_48945/g.116377 Transcript_48945/m.116377 type:complete len:251 (+) Transcript_48945:890-1642(+)